MLDNLPKNLRGSKGVTNMARPEASVLEIKVEGSQLEFLDKKKKTGKPESREARKPENRRRTD